MIKQEEKQCTLITQHQTRRPPPQQHPIVPSQTEFKLDSVFRGNGLEMKDLWGVEDR